jgi:hyperosmotically inducible periplasmic protein
MKPPLIPLLVIAFSMGAALAQLPDVKPPGDPKGTPIQNMDDETITSKVKDAISSDPQLQDMKFTVATSEAIVTLEGTARAKDEIARAVAIARAVPGVKSVINILAVADPT